jgi:hypothetical protein
VTPRGNMTSTSANCPRRAKALSIDPFNSLRVFTRSP